MNKTSEEAFLFRQKELLGKRIRKREEEILSHRILKPVVSIRKVVKIRNTFLGVPLHAVFN